MPSFSSLAHQQCHPLESTALTKEVRKTTKRLHLLAIKFEFAYSNCGEINIELDVTEIIRNLRSYSRPIGLPYTYRTDDKL